MSRLSRAELQVLQSVARVEKEYMGKDSDIFDTLRNPSEHLQEYERELNLMIRIAKRYREIQGEDWEYFLDVRSWLEMSRKHFPKALSPQEREKIKALDQRLKEAAPLLVSTIGGSEVCKRFRKRCGFPSSHWWWWLDKLVSSKSDGKRRGKTHVKAKGAKGK